MISFVVDDRVENVSKTKDAVALLKAIRVYDDVKRVIDGNCDRSSKGKMRRPAFKTKRRLLVVYQTDGAVVKAFRNIPGVDVQNVQRLSICQLAPGDAREVDHKEDNGRLNGCGFTGNYVIAGVRGCCFIRFVYIVRNHFGDDFLLISEWEIIGSLIDNDGEDDSSSQFDEKDPSSQSYWRECLVAYPHRVNSIFQPRRFRFPPARGQDGPINGPKP
jgi:hypothetical protein